MDAGCGFGYPQMAQQRKTPEYRFRFPRPVCLNVVLTGRGRTSPASPGGSAVFRLKTVQFQRLVLSLQASPTLWSKVQFLSEQKLNLDLQSFKLVSLSLSMVYLRKEYVWLTDFPKSG